MKLPGGWPSNPNASLMSAIRKKRVTSIYCTAQRWKLYRPLTRASTCGRRSRVVLTPRRWRQVSSGNATGDGGNRARSPRARRKPLKPLRTGMPGEPVGAALKRVSSGSGIICYTEFRIRQQGRRLRRRNKRHPLRDGIDLCGNKNPSRVDKAFSSMSKVYRFWWRPSPR